MPITLTQSSPLTDTTIVNMSAAYLNQLLVANATGLVTFTATELSPSLQMSASGLISPLGELPIGLYAASGTVVDFEGDSGVWSFTLEVLAGPPSPQTSIVPSTAALPTGVEIAVPFQIDPATGGVAVLFDYVPILEQHIETIVLTVVGERVMLPAYGSRLQRALFGPLQASFDALLATDIKSAIQQWEPAVSVGAVNAVSNLAPGAPTLTVTVGFSVVPFSDVSTLVISAGGAIGQVTG